MSTDSSNDSNNIPAAVTEQTAAPTAAPAATEPTIAQTAASVATSRSYKACYTKWKPRWLLIPADEAMRITVDVGYVMQCIYGIMPELERLRAEIYRECPTLSPTLMEDLAEATGGLGHCEMLKRGGAEASAETAPNPVEVVRGFRNHLVFHGGPLIAQGKLTKEDLTLSQGNSPRDIAFDVMKFAAKIGDHAEFLQGKSMLTRADLEAATKAAEDLLQFLGIKEKTQATAEEAILMRQRALTQVYELYEELRAAVRFTRRKHKDADVIMPSIFTMRPKKNNRGTEEETTQPSATTDTAGGGTATEAATGTSSTDDSSASAEGINLQQLQALMASGSAEVGAPANPSTSNTANGHSNPSGNGSAGR